MNDSSIPVNTYYDSLVAISFTESGSNVSPTKTSWPSSNGSEYFMNDWPKGSLFNIQNGQLNRQSVSWGSTHEYSMDDWYKCSFFNIHNEFVLGVVIAEVIAHLCELRIRMLVTLDNGAL